MKKTAILFILLFTILKINAETNQVRYPFFVYTDDTSVMIGGFNLVTWRDSTATENKAPNIWITNLIYSFKNQFLGFTQLNYTLKNPKYNISNFVKYQKWPTDFYEIGNNSSKNSIETITIEGIETRIIAKVNIKKNLYFSVGHLFENFSLKKFDNNSVVNQNKLYGHKGGLNSGFMLSLNYDTRNNKIFPENGLDIYFENIIYDTVIKSDYNFTNHSFSFKSFNKIGTEFIFANNLLLKKSTGTPPFYSLNKLGESLRAYNNNRFNDRNLISIKTEIRNFPFKEGFIQRFGWVMFLETGQVANSLNEFNINNFKYSVGSGIRFSLIPKEKINLRVDVAHGSDGINIIFIAQEDF